MRSRLAVLVAATAAAVALPALAEDPAPLDHSVYEIWNAIDDESISADGAWAIYSLTKEVGDGSIHIVSTDGETRYTFDRGVAGVITYDSAHALFRVKAPHEAVRAAKREKKKKDEMPKDALGVVDLATGELVTIDGITSFAVPDKAGGFAAVLLEKPKPEKKGDKAKPAAEPEEQEPAPAEEPGEEKEEPKERTAGAPLLLIDLDTGDRRTFENVLSYAFDEGGTRLAFVVSTKDGPGDGDGVYVLDLAPTGAEPRAVMTGPGEYASLVFDKAGERLAFLSNRDDFDADDPEWTLHLWTAGGDASETLARSGDAGIPDGWWVCQHRDPEFSESGERVLFGVAPRPAPEPDPEDPDTPLEDELPKLDIWHWDEPDLHTVQLNNLDEERERSYLAVADLARSGRIRTLADEAWREVEIGSEGDAPVAVALRDEPYRKAIQWDIQGQTDVAVVDVRTGRREVVLEAVRARPWGGWLSPDSAYLTYWDYDAQAWIAYDIEAGEAVDLSSAIPHPVWDEDTDTPSRPNPYGLAGWLQGDRGLLIYDRYDVWLVDPDRPESPRCLTEGVGRRDGLRFRVVDLDREEPAIDPGEPLLLSAFDEKNKNAGFYRDRVRGSRRPQQLLMAARRFSTPVRAEAADTLMLTRESFREFPDLWATGPDFSSMTRLSDANPQQADYAWGDAELVEWVSARGEPLQGILYTPPGFDPDTQYPMMVYFYERNSDTLHRYSPPTPHRSIIRFSFYASRGYLVFVPDIVYETGHPGRSAMDCVIPGVTSLVARGFVDPDRIGVQGHSWGGYQSAYLITQTDIFAAAGSGAPVSNMFSAYGGIRWGSGLSRQFQYEQTQSRIGGTIWEKPLLYIENSPLFHLDQVTTPVLILHNDEDGAVPWYQGIEMFMGLRRLGKPAWLLNYNGQPHWPITYPNRRDYAIRMQQFFDHYLMDGPMPEWMRSGVPALEKDRELGLEPAED
ncbi:MAG: S9 family peptidase [Planctomycetota bacterium]|nr:MAG: S9 family peptidase [Planctomycetota bacterium]